MVPAIVLVLAFASAAPAPAALPHFPRTGETPAGPSGGYVYWTYWTSPSESQGSQIADDIARAGTDGTNPDATFTSGVEPGAIAVSGSYIYWINTDDLVKSPPNEGGIGRANIDGSSPNPNFLSLTGGDTAESLAVQGPYLYFSWVNGPGTQCGIGRVSLEGANVDQDFIKLNSCPIPSIAASNSYLFFSNGGGNGLPTYIGRANIDGQSVDTTLIPTTHIDYIGGIATAGSYVYWADECGTSDNCNAASGTIGRANTDGSGFNDAFISVFGNPRNVGVYDGYIFWDDYADNSDSTIGSAKANGTGVNNHLVTGLYSPLNLAVTTNSLTVNSTATATNTSQASQGLCNATPGTGAPTCTLPQAILVSNDTGGQPISFDIPKGSGNTFDGGVPQIQDKSGKSIPAVTEATTIDGTSQPGGKVELSGTSGDNSNSGKPTIGLELTAPGSTVKGMVINGYSDGIATSSSGTGETIQGDWFGTDAGGTAADPDPLGTNKDNTQLLALIGVDLSSSGNTVGGPGAGQGNVFATHWNFDAGSQFRLASALYDTTGGNVIQGNWIGVVPGTQTPIIDPHSVRSAFPSAGLGVVGADTVGGTAVGDRNVLAGAGSSVGAGSVVQGNTFLGTLYADGAVTIGGPTTTFGRGRGNLFEPSVTPLTDSDRELEISGTDGVVQGNRFDPTPDPAIVDTGTVTIGGTTANAGNLIEDTATEKPGPEGLSGVDGGIVLASDGSTVENNVLENNGGWGAVQIDEGTGNTIIQNQMTGNTHGIEFGHLGYVYDTDVTKSSSGPNNLEYYPILLSTSSTGSGTTVSGRIEQPGTITVELYSEKHCGLQAEAEGQGEQYLGATTVSSTLGGEDFSFTADPTPSGQDAITATATASDGSTSEFSPCLLTDSHAPTLVGYGVRATSSSVAMTIGSPAGAAAATRAAGSGTASKRAAEGTLWLICPAATPGSCSGTVMLKSTGAGHTTIIHQQFRMAAGSAAKIIVKLTGKLLAQIEKAHKLTVRLTTKATETGKAKRSQTYSHSLTLTYAG